MGRSEQHVLTIYVLSDDELDAFYKDLDRDQDGYITFDELEARLKEVHEEIAPIPQRHHLITRPGETCRRTSTAIGLGSTRSCVVCCLAVVPVSVGGISSNVLNHGKYPARCRLISKLSMTRT